MERPEGAVAPQFLIHDRDSKLTRAFDDVFAADGIQVITTPVQAPNANAFAERWVRTSPGECLDWVLVWVGATLSGCSPSMCATTTTSDRTKARRFARRGVSTVNPALVLPRSPVLSGGRTGSAA